MGGTDRKGEMEREKLSGDQMREREKSERWKPERGKDGDIA